ncbi:ATP-binding protein [Pyrococcus kukulkanii]|uniref:ATP-binding protein n=1 Tax=Pyrococcus kukulkanii TaxID=1609559 RepID=UPI00356806D0
MYEDGESLDLLEGIPEDVIKWIKENELGHPYTDIKHGFKVGRTYEVWYVIPPAIMKRHYKKIGVNQIVLIYDFIRKAWFGGRIRSIELRRPTEPDRDKKFYDIELPNIIEQLKAMPYEFLDPMLVEIELLCMFEGRSKKPVVVSPSNASVLLLPPSKPSEKYNIPSLMEILGLPIEGIPLGLLSQFQKPYTDSEGRAILYKLRLIPGDTKKSLQNKHILVLGSTGQGKTTFLKHLIKQLVEKGYGVLVFDIQGDLVQLPFKPESELGLSDIEKQFHQEIDEREGLDSSKVRILFPMTNDLVRNENTTALEHMELLEEVSNKLGIKFLKFGLQFSEITEYEQILPYLPNLTDYAIDLLALALEEYGGVPLKIFINTLETKKKQRGDEIYIEGIDNYPVHPKTFSNLIKNLRSLEKLGIFDVRKDSGSLWELPESFVEVGKVTIIYMEHLSSHQKHVLEHFIMYHIYRHRSSIPEPGIFIVVDEAHEIIPRKSPPGGYKSYSDEVARIFSKIAREGRKYHINLIISTHLPKDIHPVVYDLCGTKVCFRMSIEDAKEVGMPNELAHQIAQFNKGFALVNSPENADISGVLPWVEIKIVPPKSLHLGPQEFFKYLEEEILPKLRDSKIPEGVKKTREAMRSLESFFRR